MLKIGCLNIGGNAKNKCETDELQQKIKNHDIFVILESWLDKSENVATIKGYSYCSDIHIRSDRKKRPKAKRASGSIIVYYTNVIAAGIKKIPSKLNDTFWLVLGRSYF